MRLSVVLKNYTVILVLSIVLFSPAVLFAGGYPFGVALDVDADFEVKDNVIGYITSNLRDNFGIKVVDDNPQLKLSVVAHVLKSGCGEKVGIAFSFVIVDLFDNSVLTNLFQDKYEKKGTSLTSNLCEVKKT